MDEISTNWYPNKRQVEQIKGGIFAKNSSAEVLAKMKNGEAYDLSKSKGFCLLLNQSRDRLGSAFDMLSIKELMERQLFMKVKMLFDCTADFFRMELKKRMNNEKMTKYSCFVLMLMAHGVGDSLIMLHGKKINLFDDVLWKIGDWPAMEGKPRVVLVQACEANDQRDKGVDGFDGDEEETDAGKESPIKAAQKLFHMLDVILIRSTHMPIIASRHPLYGTLFIQAWCEVLKRCADQLDLYQMFKNVSILMSRITTKDGHQIPTIRYSTLTRTFHFFSQDFSFKAIEVETITESWFPNKQLLNQINGGQFALFSAADAAALKRRELKPGYSNVDPWFCLIAKASLSGKGSGYDLLCVLALMEKQLGMNVDLLLDCSFEQFKRKIFELKDDEKTTQHGGFVAIVLAAENGTNWILSQVIDCFREWSSMSGKPKLFLFDGVNDTSKTKDCYTEVPDLFVFEATRPFHINNFGWFSIKANTIHQGTEVFILGTVFIQAWCEVTRHWANQLDVGRISKLVTELISQVTTESVQQTVSVRCNSLSRPLYFYQASHFKTTQSNVLIVGGWVELNPDVRAATSETFDRVIPLHCDSVSEWTFNHYQAFLFKSSIFGFEGFIDKKAILLGLDLPANKLRIVTEHPCVYGRTSSCQLDDTRLLLSCGGEDSTGFHLRTAHLFNMETSEWSDLPAMKSSRKWHSVALFNGSPTATAGVHSNKSMERLELGGGQDIWIPGPQLQQGRWKHSSAVYNGLLVVAGGVSAARMTNSVETLDRRMDKWQPGPLLNQKREFYALVVHDEKLFAIGGDRGVKHRRVQLLATTEWWDIRWPKWNQGPSLTQTRFLHGAVVVSSELLPSGLL